MQQWEYNVTEFQGSDLRSLNKLGEEGWELVAVLPETTTSRALIVLKQPKPKPSGQVPTVVTAGHP
jgi:hypothetical protein